MTDDEILAIANEVLVPAGLSGAKIYRPPIAPDEASYLAIIVQLPGETNEPGINFMAGWRAYPETIPQTPSPMMIRDAARGLISFITETTAHGRPRGYLPTAATSLPSRQP